MAPQENKQKNPLETHIKEFIKKNPTVSLLAIGFLCGCVSVLLSRAILRYPIQVTIGASVLAIGLIAYNKMDKRRRKK